MRVNRQADMLLIACPVSRVGSSHVQYKVPAVYNAVRSASKVADIV